MDSYLFKCLRTSFLFPVEYGGDGEKSPRVPARGTRRTEAGNGHVAEETAYGRSEFIVLSSGSSLSVKTSLKRASVSFVT